jgi:hypothetical protein
MLNLWFDIGGLHGVGYESGSLQRWNVLHDESIMMFQGILLIPLSG